MKHLYFFLDERVRERSVDGDAFAGVEDEHVLQQVLQLPHFAHLIFGEALVADQVGQQVLGRVDGRQNRHFVLQNGKTNALTLCGFKTTARQLPAGSNASRKLRSTKRDNRDFVMTRTGETHTFRMSGKIKQEKMPYASLR